MWMRVDDKMHVHRKTRTVIKSHPDKSRDAAPMGIWVLAGSWASDNGTDGWVPEEELDRYDDDWQSLVKRLVHAGYWWPQERAGEPGYGFNDWHDYNDPADLASKSGTYGNHVRWHVNEKRVEPDCEHCPKEPEDRGDIAPESGGDRGATSGGDSRSASGAIALPVPDPNPTPKTSASADAERDFATWWDAYPRKRDKGHAAKAYRAARKKVDAAALLTAIQQQASHLMREGVDYCPYAATWLNGERWADEPPQLAAVTRDWMNS